jgi:hypothetical protein
VTATSELAELTGVGERAVQKARKLLPQANQDSRTTVRQPNLSSPTEPQFANHSSESEPQFAPHAHAPAQMEPPSGVYISQEVASSAGEVAEIEGLNGATVDYSIWLAGLLAGPHGYRDVPAARDILNGYVRAYGSDKVHAGVLELQVRMKRGERFSDLGKAFTGYVKNAKAATDAAPPKLSKIDDRIARGRALMSPEARAAAEAQDRRAMA